MRPFKFGATGYEKKVRVPARVPDKFWLVPQSLQPTSTVHRKFVSFKESEHILPICPNATNASSEIKRSSLKTEGCCHHQSCWKRCKAAPSAQSIFDPSRNCTMSEERGCRELMKGDNPPPWTKLSKTLECYYKIWYAWRNDNLLLLYSLQTPSCHQEHALLVNTTMLHKACIVG